MSAKVDSNPGSQKFESWQYTDYDLFSQIYDIRAM